MFDTPAPLRENLSAPPSDAASPAASAAAADELMSTLLSRALEEDLSAPDRLVRTFSRRAAKAGLVVSDTQLDRLRDLCTEELAVRVRRRRRKDLALRMHSTRTEEEMPVPSAQEQAAFFDQQTSRLALAVTERLLQIVRDQLAGTDGSVAHDLQTRMAAGAGSPAGRTHGGVSRSTQDGQSPSATKNHRTRLAPRPRSNFPTDGNSSTHPVAKRQPGGRASLAGVQHLGRSVDDARA